MALVTIPRCCQPTPCCAESNCGIDEVPNPSPPITSTAANTQPLASNNAQIKRLKKLTVTSVLPSTAVRRKPQRTMIGATITPLAAQASITGVTTPAAAVAPASVVPCTYKGT